MDKIAYAESGSYLLKTFALKDRFNNSYNSLTIPQSKSELRDEYRFLNSLHKLSARLGRKIRPEDLENL